MQQIYELSLTPTYVSDWDFKMAIRELIQNGIDQQATNSKCTFSMEFVPNENDSTRGKILFTSKQSPLILLGFVQSVPLRYRPQLLRCCGFHSIQMHHSFPILQGSAPSN